MQLEKKFIALGIYPNNHLDKQLVQSAKNNKARNFNNQNFPKNYSKNVRNSTKYFNKLGEEEEDDDDGSSSGNDDEGGDDEDGDDAVSYTHLTLPTKA